MTCSVENVDRLRTFSVQVLKFRGERLRISQIMENYASRNPRGCLVTNAIVELAPHDEGVAKVVQSALARVEKAFKDAASKAALKDVVKIALSRL